MTDRDRYKLLGTYHTPRVPRNLLLTVSPACTVRAMNHADRFRLLGRYRTRRTRVGT